MSLFLRLPMDVRYAEKHNDTENMLISKLRAAQRSENADFMRNLQITVDKSQLHMVI